MNKTKTVPNIKKEDQYAQYWLTHDVADSFTPDQAIKIDFPNLKPSTETISLRLPLSLLNQIKILAHKKDIPYQSLMKMYLNQSAEKEMNQKLHKKGV